MMSWLVPLVVVVALMAWRRSAKLPPPEIGGFHVVAFPLSMRLLFSALFLVVAYLFSLTAWREEAPFWFWIFGALICSPIGLYALYAWRARLRYDETQVLSRPIFRKTQRLLLSEFVKSGSGGILGQRFETSSGATIYVNPFQRGAAQLTQFLTARLEANQRLERP
jgi:hypothetical protein